MKKSFIELDDTLYELKPITKLTVKEYNDFIDVAKKGEEKPEEEVMISILKALTTMKDWQLESLDLFSLFQVDWEKIMSSELKKDIKLNRNYKLLDKKYLLVDFERLSFGKWIDIDDIINNYPEDMSFVLAVMLIDGDYDITSINKLKAIIEENMTIQNAYSLWFAFISWRDNIFKQFSGLFKTPSEEDEQEPDIETDEDDEGEFHGNQWMEIAYSLTNEDITKKEQILGMGIIEVLNWLAHLKDKREAEKEAEKNSNANRIH